ncbi:DUF485 domain-containing protein [Roseomonas gilardii]|uniref:DUF485 domain-containing protein n=1 Tax=Roseomonas gilardii TaxID=257708 RepID=UPI0031F4D414
MAIPLGTTLPVTDAAMADAGAGEVNRILRNPTFQELVKARSGFAWTLSIVMLAIYLGFILLVAFAHGLMAAPVAGGTTSMGIVLGLVVIVSAFVLTGIYVARANTRFDEMTQRLRQELSR